MFKTKMEKKLKIETVLLRGKLNFIGNPESTFKGPIKKDMRPIAWYTQPNGEATSCHILSDVEIYEGEIKEVEMILLNQLQINHPLVQGMVLSIGNTLHKFAEFTIVEHLGFWQMGKPIK